LIPDPFDLFLSSPVIDHGVVYFGSGDFNVYALDAATGALKWKFATGNVVHATPAVADGVVYVGSWDSFFYALDAATGAVRWKYQTGRDTIAYNQVGIVGSAAVSGGVVYVGCRDGFLYALNAKTGAEKWKYNNNHGWVIASPPVSNGVVYFPTSDGTRFKAVDAATGTLRFDLANKAISFSSPAVVNNIVIFGSSDGWLHAIDATTGAVRGAFRTEGNTQNASRYIAADSTIDYAALYADMTVENVYVGLDRMHSLGAIFSSPVVANGVVYVGSSDGYVYAIR
jgi:outer membrane protein assembly factor BamB